MKRSDLLPYVAAILDDAGGVVRLGDPAASSHAKDTDDCVLVGYVTGCEPTVWAVRSYLGATLDLDEAEDIVADYLAEIGRLGDEPWAADFVLPPDGE